ncbi:MAG: hypothetical protein AAF206_13560 [Bacteroidota bacterium]
MSFSKRNEIDQGGERIDYTQVKGTFAGKRLCQTPFLPLIMEDGSFVNIWALLVD